MPKYFDFKVSGYYLYYTSHCIIEAMHVHASDKKLTEAGSAKLFVKGNGDTEVMARGILTDRGHTYHSRVYQRQLQGYVYPLGKDES